MNKSSLLKKVEALTDKIYRCKYTESRIGGHSSSWAPNPNDPVFQCELAESKAAYQTRKSAEGELKETVNALIKMGCRARTINSRSRIGDIVGLVETGEYVELGIGNYKMIEVLQPTI